jgi:hypothetical protein
MNPLFNTRFTKPSQLPPPSLLAEYKMTGLKRGLDYFCDPESLPMDCLLAFLRDEYAENGLRGLSKFLRLNEAYISSISEESLIERTNGKISLSPSAVAHRTKGGVSGFASAFASIGEAQQRHILLNALLNCLQTQPLFILEMQIAYHRPSVVLRAGLDPSRMDELETITYRDVPFPHSVLITPTAALLQTNVLPSYVVRSALDLAHEFRSN